MYRWLRRSALYTYYLRHTQLTWEEMLAHPFAGFIMAMTLMLLWWMLPSFAILSLLFAAGLNGLATMSAIYFLFVAAFAPIILGSAYTFYESAFAARQVELGQTKLARTRLAKVKANLKRWSQEDG